MSDIPQRPTQMDLVAASLKRAVRHVSRGLLDVLLPSRCLACGSGLGNAGLNDAGLNNGAALCAPCWLQIDFIDGPVCDQCGLPFEYDEGAGVLCAACVQLPPAYDRHRSVMRYTDASRALILGFKHGDRTDGAPTYGAWLKRAGLAQVRDGTFIVPVPLHRKRLFTRRYNQSALLAQEMSKSLATHHNTIVAPGLLRRTRPTVSQGNLSRSARFRNVAGAFAVHPAQAPHVKGAHVLLIDDVMTTGATLEACAKTLRRAGAASVDALTLARVVRPRTN